jgi:hypothetical protein
MLIHSPHQPVFLRSILITFSHLRLGLSTGLFPSGFPTKTVCTFHFSPRRATCPVHLIRLDSICPMLFGDDYKLWRSSLCYFPHSPVTSSHLGPNNPLRTLFSHILSLCSSLNARGQVSYPYKTTGRIMFCALTFMSRVSSGSIVSDYGLDDRAIGVRSPARAKDFSSNLCVQTGSGAHPASCTMDTGGPFPGGKSAAGAW